MGYAEAGFEVVGVDIERQARYPFPFIRCDVLDMDPRFLATFDVIHASPPCQFATLLKHAPGGKEHPNLIPATRTLLRKSGRTFVIENVEPAKDHLVDPITLCGSMFGLKAQGCELRRHRCFEISEDFLTFTGKCKHGIGPVIGVYGGHARKRSAKHGGRGTQDACKGGHKAAASEAMGMDWASLQGMSEAIPPAYTKFIGQALMAHLASQRRTA